MSTMLHLQYMTLIHKPVRNCRGCDLPFLIGEYYKEGALKTRAYCVECSKTVTGAKQEAEPPYLPYVIGQVGKKKVGRPQKWAIPQDSRYYSYGITNGQYEDMRKAQEFKCAICKTDEANCTKAKLYVDHDHYSGHVRGLLCHHCNIGIGMLKNNPSLLFRAANYLRSPS